MSEPAAEDYTEQYVFGEQPGLDKHRPGYQLIRAGSTGIGPVAASMVARQLSRLPTSVLALPTGRTPQGMYSNLSQMFQQGSLDFSQARVFNLDEFLGLTPDHPSSFAFFLRRHLLQKVNFPDRNIYLLDSLTLNVQAECRRYEKEIQRVGGLDLAILGIGRNGHLAFNEPGSSFQSRTRAVELTKMTIADNQRWLCDQLPVPHWALTIGLGTIMAAKRILLLASGSEKAGIVARALEGPVTTAIPASILQQHHSLIVILDQGAAAGLSLS